MGSNDKGDASAELPLVAERGEELEGNRKGFTQQEGGWGRTARERERDSDGGHGCKPVVGGNEIPIKRPAYNSSKEPRPSAESDAFSQTASFFPFFFFFCFRLFGGVVSRKRAGKEERGLGAPTTFYWATGESRAGWPDAGGAPGAPCGWSWSDSWILLSVQSKT
jgi:hypothetical protein